MNPEPYKLSFTGASLSISESVVIAQTYLQLKDWKAVKGAIKADNLLRARTQSSVQRVFQELAPRLQGLTDLQLELLAEGDPQEQRQILWYAICQRYAYIREFAVEVIYEKFLRMDYRLSELDYAAFFNRKADWHEELDQLTESSQIKIRTVLFRMLREVGMLSDAGDIYPMQLSVRVAQAISESAPEGPAALEIFPTYTTAS